MCMSSLTWMSVPRGYRNWVIKSRDEQAVIHRNLHSAVLIGIGASLIYGRGKTGSGIAGRSSYVRVNGVLTHPLQYELSSMNHVDEIVKNSWFIINQLTGGEFKGDTIALIEKVYELNNLVAA